MFRQERIANALLVIRCRQGEAQAWQELVDRWERPLYYYIRRLVQEDSLSEQAVQEVWMRAVRGIHRLRDVESFAPWIYRIARHAAINQIRDESLRRNYLKPQESVAEEAGFEEEILAAENAEWIHRGLEKLSGHHREILTLFFLQDLSVKEISEVVGIPAGTVKSRIHHAKKKLKEILDRKET